MTKKKDICIHCNKGNTIPGTFICLDCLNHIEDKEVELKNVGAGITASLLKEIADTGEHHGTFGGEEVEACAQSILKLHNKIKELELKLVMYKDELDALRSGC